MILVLFKAPLFILSSLLSIHTAIFCIHIFRVLKRKQKNPCEISEKLIVLTLKLLHNQNALLNFNSSKTLGHSKGWNLLSSFMQINLIHKDHHLLHGMVCIYGGGL